MGAREPRNAVLVWPRSESDEEGPPGGVWYALGAEGEPRTFLGRFRLTIRDEAHVYEIQVPWECFTEVRVGDAWPSDVEACD